MWWRTNSALALLCWIPSRDVDRGQASIRGGTRQLFHDNARSLNWGEISIGSVGHRVEFCATLQALWERRMSDQVLHLINKIGALEAELEVEFAKNGCDFQFNSENGRINFEPEMLRLHKEQKTSLLHYILNARPLAVLSSPFVYGLIVPLVFLDLSVSIFQAVCFPAFGIQKVRRNDYLVFDHRYLGYLNTLEKLNCAYCSYANGIIAFFREVAGRAEQHWCPIKHARRILAAHPHYSEFADYGDAEAYRQLLTGAENKVGLDQPAQFQCDPGSR